ncbi:MAG: hypothetical protein JWN46_623 [Acidimicrobiales bacterium]|nr:hypothetical protein [Acidimicrobiales bacterium]
MKLDELAAQLGRPAADLIAAARLVGVDAQWPGAELDDETARWIQYVLTRDVPPEPMQPASRFASAGAWSPAQPPAAGYPTGPPEAWVPPGGAWGSAPPAQPGTAAGRSTWLGLWVWLAWLVTSAIVGRLIKGVVGGNPHGYRSYVLVVGLFGLILLWWCVRRTSGRGRVALWALVLAVFGLNIAVLAVRADRSRAVAALQSAQSMSAFRLQVGQCFVERTVPVVRVGIVACTEPHYGEVYEVQMRPEPDAAAWPGRTQLLRMDLTTLLAFRDYVGTAYTSSSLTSRVFVPTGTVWSAGERHVIFFLVSSGGPMSGSSRGSHR